MSDTIVDYLKSHNRPLTVSNYLSLSWLGDPPELEGELAAELDDLIESGELRDDRPSKVIPITRRRK